MCNQREIEKTLRMYLSDIYKKLDVIEKKLDRLLVGKLPEDEDANEDASQQPPSRYFNFNKFV